jgi:hypothetical protein
MKVLIERYENGGEFWELRQQFRKHALESLRKREGFEAPVLIDGRWMYRDAEGNAIPWATGKVKQPSAGEMDAFWAGVNEGVFLAENFEVLKVAEDGVPLNREVKDLERDANKFFIAERVSHGMESSANPDFELSDVDDEAHVDKVWQAYIRKGSNG